MRNETYSGLKAALKKANIQLPQVTNVLEVGCLHSVYNKSLREELETVGRARRKQRRTVHLIACDLPSLHHLKKGEGTIKAWKETHKHTEVHVLKHQRHIAQIHKKTKKKHLQTKGKYHLILSIRPDLKNQECWLEAYKHAWVHQLKQEGSFVLFLGKSSGNQQQRKAFIEKIKKKLKCNASKPHQAKIPLTDAEIIIFNQR